MEGKKSTNPRPRVRYAISAAGETKLSIWLYFCRGNNERRNGLLAQVQSIGLLLKYLWEVYGEERDREFEQSGFALNMRLYESEMLEIVRLLYRPNHGLQDKHQLYNG